MNISSSTQEFLPAAAAAAADAGGFPPPPPPPPPPPAPPPAPHNAGKNDNTENVFGAIKTNSSSSCYQVSSNIDENKDNDEIVAFVESGRCSGESGGSQECPKEILTIKHYVAIYSRVRPILQQGPVCGLVSLSMVGQLYEKNVDTDDILAAARTFGYSMKGEMFSVEHMKTLAGHFYPECKFEIASTTEEGCMQRLIDTLVDGDAILVPYDADYNHGPGLRKGHAAHWALAHGILGAVPGDHGIQEKLLVAGEVTCKGNDDNVTILNNLATQDTRDLLKKTFIHTNIFAICHQGKSTHLGIWWLEKLLKSNQNLKEIAPKLTNDHGSDMVLSNISNGLCNQIILVGRK